MIFSIAVVLMFSDDLINTRCVTLTITGHFIELMVNGKNLSTSGKLSLDGGLDEDGQCGRGQYTKHIGSSHFEHFEIL